MNILAVDIGTLCGYADNYSKANSSGVWELKTKRLEGPGMRYLRFKNKFSALAAQGAELVAFEEVRSHMGVAAAHVYGGIVAMLMAVCEEKDYLYTSVPVGTWKKEICGNGKIKPADYLKFVQNEMAPMCKSEDEAAAICILAWAETQYNASNEDYLR